MAKRVKEKKRDGTMRSHGYEAMRSAPSLINVPQDALGSWTPKPRKERVDYRSMTAGTSRVA